jgi:coenzyme PQQ synthesis protein D (PqqD)
MSPAKKSPEKFKHAAHTAWRRVENESIILDLNSSVYYSLNDTGAFIWERLGAGDAASKVAAALSVEFDVKPEAAARDLDELVEKLCKEKLLIPA